MPVAGIDFGTDWPVAFAALAPVPPGHSFAVHPAELDCSFQLAAAVGPKGLASVEAALEQHGTRTPSSSMGAATPAVPRELHVPASVGCMLVPSTRAHAHTAGGEGCAVAANGAAAPRALLGCNHGGGDGVVLGFAIAHARAFGDSSTSAHSTGSAHTQVRGRPS